MFENLRNVLAQCTHFADKETESKEKKIGQSSWVIISSRVKTRTLASWVSIRPVFVKVLQRNITNKICREIRSIIGIGSCCYGCREVPWFAICKQKNQEGHLCSSV